MQPILSEIWIDLFIYLSIYSWVNLPVMHGYLCVNNEIYKSLFIKLNLFIHSFSAENLLFIVWNF